MGGNALKTVTVSRIPLSRYVEITKNIKSFLKDLLQIAIPKHCPNKADFGDIDILYVPPSTPSFDVKQFVKDLLHPVEIVTNGNMFSIGYKDTLIIPEKGETVYFYQIDFIACPNLPVAEFYYSYSDVGKILGKIVKSHNLSFGDSGLLITQIEEKTIATIMGNIPVPSSAKNLSIVLETDIAKICSYIGIDYSLWLSGFKCDYDIYNWLKSSTFYSPEIFKVLNKENRKRSINRPFYTNFLISIFGIAENINDVVKNNMYVVENGQVLAIRYFHKENEVIQLVNAEIVKETRKNKYSGKLFIDLGITPKNVKKQMYEFEKWILATQTVANVYEWVDGKENANEIREMVANYLVSNKR
jgi:hypothetical protein